MIFFSKINNLLYENEFTFKISYFIVHTKSIETCTHPYDCQLKWIFMIFTEWSEWVQLFEHYLFWKRVQFKRYLFCTRVKFEHFGLGKKCRPTISIWSNGETNKQSVEIVEISTKLSLKIYIERYRGRNLKSPVNKSEFPIAQICLL